MVIVEPLVSEEKLRQLLDEQAESAALDYKAICDLREKADTVELAKDVGAMQVAGGYIVIGADNNGRPTNGVAAERVALFDEATLRAKLRKWLPEPLDLLAAAHEIDGSKGGLIYVGGDSDGLCVNLFLPTHSCKYSVPKVVCITRRIIMLILISESSYTFFPI